MHSSLLQVQKKEHFQAKEQNFKINPSKMNFRIKGIHKWLEQIIKNYDHKQLPDQMMNMIKTFDTGEIFRKTTNNHFDVMIAGEITIFNSSIYKDIN